MTKNILPFRAALFDLDGTLLDSMGVWRGVDRQFLGRRGIPVPEDYSRGQQGKSFRECAEYAIDRFGLKESAEDVMEEWLELTRDVYAHHVTLKPGARDYLRRLKRAGVKLAAATANRRTLFMPALERCGIAELFDVVCTSAEVGDCSKRDGALFRLVAAKLGVEPADCVVFEDALEGVAGARTAGMGCWAVREIASAHHAEQIAALADGVIDDFTRLPGALLPPENRRRCVIFTARCDGDPREACAPRADDTVLCADGGWRVARAMGLTPTMTLGDFDSSDAPETGEVRRFPREKDDTDTMLCLKQGLAMGLDDFLIVGGFGGRLDHTLANLQALRYAARRGAPAEMSDGLTWAAVVENGARRVPARPGKLSVLALSDTCRGVTIRGAKYDVENITLTNAFPLGACNDVKAEYAEISVEQGPLLVLTCPE